MNYSFVFQGQKEHTYARILDADKKAVVIVKPENADLLRPELAQALKDALAARK